MDNRKREIRTESQGGCYDILYSQRKRGEVMKERPILFSTEMIKSILENRKTQTRRVIKPQPPEDISKFLKMKLHTGETLQIVETPYSYKTIKCPYGVIGGGLWVRETFSVRDYWDNESVGGLGFAKNRKCCYKADGNKPKWAGRWRPSIFMPRWASRINLEIVNIRIERIQEITYDDCLKEGWNGYNGDYGKTTDVGGSELYADSRAWYQELWDSINAKRGYDWAKNVWVWVIEFKRI